MLFIPAKIIDLPRNKILELMLSLITISKLVIFQINVALILIKLNKRETQNEPNHVLNISKQSLKARFIYKTKSLFGDDENKLKFKSTFILLILMKNQCYFQWRTQNFVLGAAKLNGFKSAYAGIWELRSRGEIFCLFVQVFSAIQVKEQLCRLDLGHVCLMS